MAPADIFLQDFVKLCNENKRLFLSDPNDFDVADTLLDFHRANFSEQILRDTAETYIKASPDTATITMKNFAIRVGEFRQKVAAESVSRAQVDQLMKETKERMKGSN